MAASGDMVVQFTSLCPEVGLEGYKAHAHSKKLAWSEAVPRSLPHHRLTTS